MINGMITMLTMPMILISAYVTRPIANSRHDQAPAIRSALGTSVSSRLDVEECTDATWSPTIGARGGGTDDGGGCSGTGGSAATGTPSPTAGRAARTEARPDSYARRALARNCSKRLKHTSWLENRPGRGWLEDRLTRGWPGNRPT
jgi:hypothetical protein